MKRVSWLKSTLESLSGSLSMHEHQVELVLPPVIPGWERMPCRWATFECAGERWYLCSHAWICLSCGKHMKDTKRWDCPDYQPV
jgi:hypothetical protein